jgi:uncharacterized protein GlcG (DUF336 family)
MKLTEEIAQAAITAARKAASVIGVPMKTSALFGMTSEAVGEFCKPGGPSPGLELTNGTLVVFAGGVPIWDRNRTLIGAVGISGGAVEQDRQVAQAAADAVHSATA